jgi:hypothetical protein
MAALNEISQVLHRLVFLPAPSGVEVGLTTGKELVSVRCERGEVVLQDMEKGEPVRFSIRDP